MFLKFALKGTDSGPFGKFVDQLYPEASKKGITHTLPVYPRDISWPGSSALHFLNFN